MADDSHSRQMQRPRPVAEVPLEPLLEMAPDIVRGWAIALIRTRPLEAIGGVPLQALAGEGVSLCEQLLRALCSESDFDKLLDGAPRGREGATSHPRQALEIAGARDPGNVVETIESLRGVVWETIAVQLGAAGAAGRSQTTLLADLSDRLANVCAALSAGAIAGSSAGSVKPTDVIVGTSPVARSPEPMPTRAVRADTGIVIVDERGAILRDPHRHESGGRTRRKHDESAARAEQEEAPPRAEIAIHDARGEEGPAAWIRSIGRQLERYERDGLPFVVVLLEIEGDVAREELESLERVLAGELQESGGGTLTRERAGRYWLLAHRTDRIGAHALAVRLERALVTAATSGAPVVASGIAICPEDGIQPATLAAQADVGLYAARSEAGHTSAGPEAPPA
jgi:hypothetical protein